MKWSKEEVEYLEACAKQLKTSSEITKLFLIQFSTRSKSAVQTKIQDMSLIPSSKPCDICKSMYRYARGLCKTCYKKSDIAKERLKKRWRSKEAKAVQVRHYHKYNEKKRKEDRKRWKKRDEETKLKTKVVREKYSRTFNSQFLTIRREAFKRDLDFNISKEEYKNLRSDNSCIYCKGSLPSVGHGLDRKNNSVGYLFENVVPCCGTCNSIKSDILTYDEMLVGMKAVLEFRLKK